LSHKRKSRTFHAGTPERFLRTIFTIIVLSALVLGISYFVRELSTFDIEKAYTLAEPVLTKAGVDEEDIGRVAGIFNQRPLENGEEFFDAGTNGAYEAGDIVGEGGSQEGQLMSSNPGDVAVQKTTDFTIAVMTDSHNYNGVLKRALELAKEEEVEAVFYLGDFTDWGDVSSLQNAKDVIDDSDVDYYAIPGDHDIAQSLDTSNYEQVFGNTKHSVEIGDKKFVLFDNSANKTAISTENLDWLKNELKDADYVFLSQPLYHPSNDRVMGILDGEEIKIVRDQAEEILKWIVDSDVSAVIAGDQHNSSTNKDLSREDLKHVVVGALTETRNMQEPRFTLMHFYTDGTYGFEEVMLK
jgi:predicted phosphodiesterase